MSTFDFESFTTRYHPKNALLLAKIAELTYLDTSAINRNLVAWGLPEHHWFDRNDSQGFIATNEEVIIVAFRGTELGRLRDFMTDLEVWLEPGPGGQVHRGFRRALDQVWDEILETIEAYQEPTVDGTRVVGKGKSLWFTGHSLGGALATLAVARLRLELDQGVFGLYTFGSPRVGDRTFADAFNNVFGRYTFRFVNHNDVISRIPLRRMRYSHVGQLIYITSEGQLSSDVGWWWRFLDRVRGHIDDYFDEDKMPDGVKDHLPPNYINALAKHLEWWPD